MKKTPTKAASKSNPTASENAWLAATRALNTQTINAIGNGLDRSPEGIVREALEIAMPTFAAEAKAKHLSDNLDAVIRMDESGADGKRAYMSLGFHNGKLVQCDGSQYQPISLAGSVCLYARLVGNGTLFTWNDRAVSRWFKMISTALHGA